MSIVDRRALSRCCALFGGLCWICAAVVVLAAFLLISRLAAVPGIGSDTIAAGAASSVMAATTDLAGDSMKAFAIAVAAFGTLAVGSIVAGLGLATGRRVLLAGGRSPLLTAGLVSCTTYLAAVSGLLVHSIV
ncbi:MAG: hypothetical protein QF723_02500 [Phycisphaerales bacterium]|jgi:hypothetical protein|nr:hypothetical protein [Phycisphaerales bacterium]MDP6311850.1 hypothetical protein [Phycisphaerales bacterium]MDP7086316.1 hypothetical protein [Phycisphaerales bacterium]MDP7520428.1 hypothetical protein [Phycisphaerales bacterium]MDP7573960.1 hypothetical protein [Phycisphaerales bacterium]